ncbi:MAG: DNA-processing protein DprA [Proteobacteria bacterium]|nr:DNA-processing protein DprA [Actinomycetota bacterium]MBU4259502.1 DNA-processing protein DprA [Pseudomonadota bacterium]MBU4289329.1 DNA-processing protein DprA [Pseudomonadota bacterium]MBU4414326.1 DNA-processing protein DprA [Pseudomonadota bacterium]MCG2759166.1 DNA-processing protein DprA [Desulfobacteraceae bacterium]
METTNLKKNNPHYPSALKQHLGKDAPNNISSIGNLDILRHNSTSFFCSTKCPGDLIVKTYDFAQILRDADMTVISGFHSPMERECLTILLRGAQPVIVCPAKSIDNMRINREYKKPLKDGRLLFLSPFDKNQRRISAKSSHYRNLFVAALSAVIFVTHAEPSSKTEGLCRRLLFWQKPLYTFDSDFNKNIIDMGARPVKPENVSEWEEFFAS